MDSLVNNVKVSYISRFSYWWFLIFKLWVVWSLNIWKNWLSSTSYNLLQLNIKIVQNTDEKNNYWKECQTSEIDNMWTLIDVWSSVPNHTLSIVQYFQWISHNTQYIHCVTSLPNFGVAVHQITDLVVWDIIRKWHCTNAR